MSFSQRGNAYLESVRHGAAISVSVVTDAFREYGIPPIAEFVECVRQMESVVLAGPRDRVYFTSLADLAIPSRYTRNPRLVTDNHGNWLSVCESRYPGVCFLHEAGSLHFENDINAVWFRKWSTLVEYYAFIDSVIGTSSRFTITGIVKCSSLDVLLRQLRITPDLAASDEHSVVSEFIDSSVIELLHIDCIPQKGACAIGLYTNSCSSVNVIKEALGDKLVHCQESAKR